MSDRKPLFRDVSIKVLLFLLTFVPVLALVVLAAWIVLPRVSTIQAYNYLGQSIELSKTMSALIHEQQKERGATAAFMTTAGTEFGDQLRDQRQIVDGLRADVPPLIEAFIEELGSVPETSGVTQRLSRVLEDLERYESVRASIDTLTIPRGEALGYFTELNNDIADAIYSSSVLSSNPVVMTRIRAFAAFLRAKDLAGLERAIGASGYGAGSFTTQDFVRYERLISVQDVYFRSFLAGAPDELRLAFEELSTSEVSRVVVAMRRQIEAAGPNTPLGDTTGPEFFAAVTAKIDAMKSIEDRFAETLGATIEKRRSAAWFELASTLAAMALVLIVCFFGGRYVSRIIRQDLAVVAVAATRMARGDLNLEKPTFVVKESGEIGAALDQFRQSILAAHQKEAARNEELARENERRLQQERETRRLSAEKADAERLALEEQRAVEQAIVEEIAGVVGASAAGDFSRRLDLRGKDGVFEQLCRGINEIGTSTELGLSAVVDVLERLSKGDLDGRMPEASRGMFATIARQLISTSDQLQSIVAQIDESSSTIDASSAMVATMMGDISERSEASATALEETAKELGGLSDAVSATASGAQQALAAAQGAQEQVGVTVSVSTDTVAAMEKLEESSEKMLKIIDTIDMIAFQTNLLALNAGVEAARAGPAGRGFAVVASEVGNLAQRASKSAGEIATLIKDSEAQVAEGASCVNRSRVALDQIKDAIESVAAHNAEIAQSTVAQSGSISAISETIREIDASARETSVQFEKNAASTRAIHGESQKLVAAVGVFNGQKHSVSDAA